jgi:hypothetical protein
VGSPIDDLILDRVRVEPGVHLAVVRREILLTGLRAQSTIHARVFALAAAGRLRIERDALNQIHLYPPEAAA